jgi:hypothetical protein
MLVIPGQFAMAFGFVLPYGKLLQSLANSNLVPSMFNLKDNKSPHKAIVIATVISFLFCCVALSNKLISDSMNNIAILAEFCTNISTLLGFIMMRLKYSSISRGFQSPFGVTGAIISIVIFLLGFISLVGNFQDDYDVSFVCVLLIMGLLSLYYYFVAEKTQKFSMDEEQSLLKLHVININKNKRKSLLVYKATKKLKKIVKLIKLKKLESFSKIIVKNKNDECSISTFVLNSVKYKNHDNFNGKNNIDDFKENNKSISCCKIDSDSNETSKNSSHKINVVKKDIEKKEIDFYQINNNNNNDVNNSDDKTINNTINNIIINNNDDEFDENENALFTNEQSFVGLLIQNKRKNRSKRKIFDDSFFSSSKVHPLPL